MPRRPELRGGHRRDRRVVRRQRGHRTAQRTLGGAMLTLALALVLHVQACPQRIVVTVPSTRSTTASISLLECGRRARRPVGGPRRLPRRLRAGTARATARRRSAPTGSGRRSTASAPTPAGSSATTGSSAATGGTRIPARRRYNRFRHVACGATPAVRRRQRGPLAASASPTARSRSCEYNTATARPRPRLGDLPARQHRPADERLRQPRAGPAALRCSRGCGRERGSRSVLHNFRLSV